MSDECGCKNCREMRERAVQREREEIIKELEYHDVAPSFKFWADERDRFVRQMIDRIRSRGEPEPNYEPAGFGCSNPKCLCHIKSGPLKKVHWNGSDLEGIARTVFELNAMGNRLIDVVNELKIKVANLEGYAGFES